MFSSVAFKPIEEGGEGNVKILWIQWKNDNGKQNQSNKNKSKYMSNHNTCLTDYTLLLKNILSNCVFKNVPL